MRRHIALRWARNPWFAALVLGAIFARALIPVGYMPGAGGVMLCPGYASTSPGNAAHLIERGDMSRMDMPEHDMGMTGHGGKESGHEPICLCPFTAAAVTLGLGHTPALATYAPAAPADIHFTPQPFIPRGTVVPSRLPRGPPPAHV